MNLIAISKEKLMTAAQRKELMPYEILADGVIIAVVRKPEDQYAGGRVTCPNCKYVVELPKQDNSPSPFSIQHP